MNCLLGTGFRGSGSFLDSGARCLRSILGGFTSFLRSVTRRRSGLCSAVFGGDCSLLGVFGSGLCAFYRALGGLVDSLAGLVQNFLSSPFLGDCGGHGEQEEER